MVVRILSCNLISCKSEDTLSHLTHCGDSWVELEGEQGVLGLEGVCRCFSASILVTSDSRSLILSANTFDLMLASLSSDSFRASSSLQRNKARWEISRSRAPAV